MAFPLDSFPRTFACPGPLAGNLLGYRTSRVPLCVDGNATQFPSLPGCESEIRLKIGCLTPRNENVSCVVLLDGSHHIVQRSLSPLAWNRTAGVNILAGLKPPQYIPTATRWLELRNLHGLVRFEKPRLFRPLGSLATLAYFLLEAYFTPASDPSYWIAKAFPPFKCYPF